jgi:hypothetical protein
MQFSTKYGMAIQKVLMHYPLGSKSLMVALEAIVNTAMERAKEERLDETAQQFCRELHEGPARGLVCKLCFEAVESGKLPSDETEAPTETAAEAAERESIVNQVHMLIDAKLE